MTRTVRRLRPVSDPLGSYLRVTARDHTFLTQMLVEGRGVGSGFVADPALGELHEDLFRLARESGLETILDPRTLDLSTPGGLMRAGASTLPWGRSRPHTPSDLMGLKGKALVEQFVDAFEVGGHTAVLAPTHYIRDPSDPWVKVDADLTTALRSELNARGFSETPIHYPLITRGATLYKSTHRGHAIKTLRRLPIDSVWLRVHPFCNNTSGPLSLTRYIQACRELHELELPLVGEHTGAVGVALLAFGAVGGIESGVTVNDHSNLSSWLKAPKPGSGGNGEARVYLHELASFLPRSKAAALFQRPGMKAAHGCRNRDAAVVDGKTLWSIIASTLLRAGREKSPLFLVFQKRSVPVTTWRTFFARRRTRRCVQR